MRAFRPFVASLAGGEISSRLSFRSDLERHQIAARRVENALITTEGGAAFRGGSRFVAAVKDAAYAHRKIGFVYSDEQAYMTEWGQNSLRIYKDKGRIELPAPGASITGESSTFDTTVGSWTDSSSGGGAIAHDAAIDALKLVPGAAGVARARLSITTTAVGVAHTILFRTIKTFHHATRPMLFSIISGASSAEVLPRSMAETGWHAVTLTPSASPFVIELALNNNGQAENVAWIDDVSVHAAGAFTLASPFTAAQMADVYVTQSRDTLYLTHPSAGWWKLLRYGHTAWSLVRVRTIDGPYNDTNTGPMKITPSAGTGGGITLAADGALFAATDVGRVFRVKGTNWGWGIITGFTDAQNVTAQVIGGDIGSTATATWRLGLFSDTTGWPGALTFSEQRLVATGPPADDTAWAESRTGQFEDYAPSELDGTVKADSAIAYRISSAQANPIRWVYPARALLLGTAADERHAGDTAASGFRSPVDGFPVVPDTYYGSARRQPVGIEDAVIFLQAHARRLRATAFTFESDAFRGGDLTTFNFPITKSGVADFCYQQEPHSVLWACRNDGLLIGLTHVREQKLYAWHRHPMTNGLVESLAVIPGTGEDELWLTVRRVIDGATVRYTEILEAPPEEGGDILDCFRVDCGLSYDGAPITTLTGLEHLKGQTVSVLADGVDLGDFTVTAAGTVALGRSASVVHAGLKIESLLKPMRLDLAQPGFTTAGLPQKIGAVWLMLESALGGKIGRDEAHLQDIEYRTPGGDLAAALTPFTGLIETAIDGEWSTDASLVIFHDRPLPFYLAGIAPVIKVGG